jgi:hypothetical protein
VRRRELFRLAMPPIQTAEARPRPCVELVGVSKHPLRLAMRLNEGGDLLG